MSHRVISLKYRPQDFDELTGQSHVVLSLKGAIKSGRIGHAFLFAGPRGVGKTTTARILAKSLNCIEGPTIHPCQKCQSCREIALSRSVDVVEIDGASNRRIDEIRDLREAVIYSPLHSKHKVYIIDEVHMLTPEAFNALLKTLEEPPPQVIFMFATTDPIKVPQTILSRCERFAFKRLSTKEIAARLQSIAERESISITDRAIHYIALRADGSIRDGESILEQLASFVEGQITEQDVFKLIGFLSSDFYYHLVQHILEQKYAAVLGALNQSIEDGADPLEMYRGLVDYLRSVLLVQTELPDEFLTLGADEIERVKSLHLSRDKVMSMIEVLLRSEELTKRSMNVRVAMELLLCQLVRSVGAVPVQENTKGPGDVKQKILDALQAQSPKLAALIHQSSVKIEGKDVFINAENDFAQKQLERSKEVLQAILKNVLNNECAMHFGIAENQKKANNLEDTIRVLFDSEEVR